MDEEMKETSATRFTYGDFLTFEKMISPLVVQIGFLISVPLVVFAGLLLIVEGARKGMASYAVYGLLLIPLGLLILRLIAESTILLYRIHDVLVEIKNNTEQAQRLSNRS